MHLNEYKVNMKYSGFSVTIKLRFRQPMTRRITETSDSIFVKTKENGISFAYTITLFEDV